MQRGFEKIPRLCKENREREPEVANNSASSSTAGGGLEGQKVPPQWNVKKTDDEFTLYRIGMQGSKKWLLKKM